MAKIGLIDVDGHHGKKKFGATIYPNLALCKISAWHKAKGDIVEWAIPLMEHYDIIYRSKIFNFSRDDDATYFADKVVRGGTGYDIHSQLPKEIDDMQPDLSIYPYLPKGVSYGFLTRGCPNKCSWCVVPEKEGAIVPYWDVDRVANGNEKIILMDNNILAAGDYGMEQLRKIIERGYRVDFNQALDARLVNPENAKLLANISWLENNRIRFGCDTPKQIEWCDRAISMIEENGFNGQFFLYTMIGLTSLTECYERVHHWWLRMRHAREYHDHCYCYPHVQPFRDPYNPKQSIPQWQKDMAGWCNKRMIFTTVDFLDYEPRKGFKCSEYFNSKLCQK